jgi:hypothetical protein
MRAATAPVTPARTDRAQGAVLTVDLHAIAANAELFASRTRGEVMAVVKADGFGHGGAEAARTALANGATWPGSRPAATPPRADASCWPPGGTYAAAGAAS